MAKRKGRQTPTKEHILPFKKSKGAQAVKLYNSTGFTVQTWQKNVLRAMLAVESDGLWTHTKFCMAVSRRNGKTEVICARAIYGLYHGEIVKYTAHQASTSRTTWEHVCFLLDKLSAEYEAYRSAGREEIIMQGTGGKIKFATRTGKAGLGTGCDCLIIDEAQEYTAEQESALKYTVTSSANPQTVFCGTPPTQTSTGTVFKLLRDNTFAGKTLNTGWVEWSVEKMTDVWDREAWYEANPSLNCLNAKGVPLLKERDIADEIGTDDIDFNIQRLGLWLEYNQRSAITAVMWDRLCISDKAKISRFCVGVKFGIDGINACAAIASKQPDGRIYTEVIGKKPLSEGIDWIVRFLVKNKQYIQRTVIDGKARQDVILQAMKDNHLKKAVIPTTTDIIAIYSLFEAAIYNVGIIHMKQDAADHVITNCQKRNIGGGGGFGYKAIYEDDEIGLLESTALAYWGCAKWREQKQKIEV